ncbi:hypothetical protein D9619_007008 [Psilocybe cf. subviscida]|uniref:Cwf19-like C-terminal domain-containing protein n=1 Tax=Psilocybe cf. subviscida TaxID=2480587 RepID=A0A8H5EX20_9AGAR|nr:hypothetical protein D9619_007008 [Psilocybe cf. subviscida]
MDYEQSSSSKHRDSSSKHKSSHSDRDRDSSRSHKHRDKDKDKDHSDSEKKHKKRHRHDDDDEGSHKRHHKSKRDKEVGDEGKSKHRDKKDKKEKKEKRSKEKGMDIVDDDHDMDNMWTEKDITMDGERVLAADIPSAESLKITSSAEGDHSVAPLHSLRNPETSTQRDDWMMLPPSTPVLPPDPRRTQRPLHDVEMEESLTEDYGEPTGESRTVAGGVDFFSSLGTERKKAPRPDKPDPDKMVIHHKELNVDLKEGKPINFDEAPPPPPKNTPGGPGSSWRMMRLKRVYETAEEDGLPLEQVAVERFGSLEAFEEAKEERQILDERQGKSSSSGNTGGNDTRGRGTDRPTQYSKDGGGKGLMFTDMGGSASSSRSSSFRRPGGMADRDSGPSTPSPSSGPAASGRAPANRRLDSLRLPSQANSPLAQSHTPIPSVMTPPPPVYKTSTGEGKVLTTSELNKMQAKVIRAKLMGTPDAAKLEAEYEAAAARSAQGLVSVSADGATRTKVEVLPTLDAQGRMYDVGHGAKDEDTLPGNKKKKEKHFATHDPKTGEVLRINADDDTMTLGEMLRQERMGAGMADQKNLDALYARQVMGDAKFQNDLDYIDDNAEKLGRQKMRSDAMKRQFAINDYKQTQKALASCNFCYGEDDSLPRAPVVAMGTRVYLSCTITEELVPGHCLIVPIQHCLNMLEGDDDNFMKCLMRMFAEDDKGVVFFETVLSLRKQKHTYIECLPVPWELYDLLPGYFKESILSSEAEWSQHRKLIDFSARPGGFRRAMVPNLPYFMVQFDHKGEKGYGHVIEGAAEAHDEDEQGMAEGEKGGGEFPLYFATEIIGNQLDLEARKWRRPRKVDTRRYKERVEDFKKMYKKFDWTGMLN